MKRQIRHIILVLLHHFCISIAENITTIVDFFIPVSSLKVFDHSIHSKRRKIYLGESIQALQNDTLSYHDYSVSGSSSQLCSGIPLKKIRLFSPILVHYKKIPRQSVIKVSKSIQNSQTSSHKIQAKTFTWPNMLFHARQVTLMRQTKESNKRALRLLVKNILVHLASIYTLAFSDVLLVLH